MQGQRVCQRGGSPGTPSELREDGRTHAAKITTVPGGVGRNMSEALHKLKQNPLLISAIGDDLFGREILRNFSQNHMDRRGISISTEETPTAIYSALLNHQGECLFGLGDMSAHSEISPAVVHRHDHVIRHASIVLLDGNIPVETMTAALEICSGFSIPVWFEPTEIRKARKILEVPSEHWHALKYISPNLRELISISDEELPSKVAERSSDQLGGDLNEDSTVLESDGGTLAQLISHCFEKFSGLEIILLTRGARGFYVIQRTGESFRSIHYPPPGIRREDIKSVSGAGDCLNAGFITGLLSHFPLAECAALGTHCAKMSLETNLNVPLSFEICVGALRRRITGEPHVDEIERNAD